MIDYGTQAAYLSAIAVAGVAINYSRNTGFAPNVITVTASITAVVRTVQPDTTAPAQAGLSSSAPGSINQDQRLIILMAQDLTDGGIVLPVQKGDTVSIPSTGETLSVDRSDPYKRALAGAIEVFASAPT